ncbi:MAG: A24 family peptidase [Mycobacteriaceae bacterium]
MGVAEALAGLAVVVWSTTLSVIDVRQRRLPNVLTLSGAVLILLGSALCGRGLPAILGAGALGGLYLAVHLADPAALGGGDVKLALALGALTGAFGVPVWVLAALGAPVLTAVVGTVTLVLRRGRAGLGVPHGPSMCMTSLAAVALAVF